MKTLIWIWLYLPVAHAAPWANNILSTQSPAELLRLAEAAESREILSEACRLAERTGSVPLGCFRWLEFLASKDSTHPEKRLMAQKKYDGLCVKAVKKITDPEQLRSQIDLIPENTSCRQIAASHLKVLTYKQD